METSCKGIWIPEELWQNEELTVMEKLFAIKIINAQQEKHKRFF
ncbi:hypothetical protein [Clostridium gasigenes]|nr:hypothetical protein [Clostridium gasigenes]